MPISSNLVLEVRTTGDDLNGGGFITGASGTDRSQQDAAHATLTTASTVHTTTTQINVNAADYTVTSADVGNIFQLTGGTATAGFYQITAADTVNNRWTVDKSAGTSGQTCPGKMGGALASTGKLGHSHLLGSSVANQKAWVKSGTYTLTTTTDNVAGGLLNIGGFAVGVVVEGYQTTRGDRAARPVIHAGSVTGIANGCIRGAGSRSSKVVNIEYNANGGTGNIVGFGVGPFYYLCSVRNASVAGGVGFSGTSAVRCAAISCTVGYGNGGTAYESIADACSVGFEGGMALSFCIAKGCTTRGYNMSSSRSLNCLAYNCVDGFDWTSSVGGPSVNINSIAYGNSGFGFRSSFGTGAHFTLSCAGGSNTSGNFSGTIDEGAITLSVDPFTNAAGGDFSLNNTAGGGALLRAAGIRFGDALNYDQVDYRDVGPFQHQDAGGGGGLLVNPGMSGGMI